MARGARWLMIARWAGLILLTPIVAILTGFSFLSSGETRTLWIIGVIASALALAFLQVYSEIQAWKVNKSSVSVRVALAGTLNGAARPLVTLMGRIAEAHGEDRRGEVKTLISRIAGIAYSQCGKLAGRSGESRCVLYQFTSEEVLARIYEEGRPGRAARQDFVEGRTANDTEVIRIARGENSLLIPDVDSAPPEYYADYPQREYKCFLMVPVRTSRRSYGFLSIDSDKPFVLTKADVGFATLMAHLLGSALALLGEPYPRLGDVTVAVPSQGNGHEATEAREVGP